jgi:hypothetical protein
MRRGKSELVSHEHIERLTLSQYEARIVALYSNLPRRPTREQERQVSRAELDLVIDYRLGVDFPQVRRDAIWQIQVRIRRRGIVFLARYLLSRLLHAFIGGRPFDMTRVIEAEYAQVLDEGELRRFLV